MNSNLYVNFNQNHQVQQREKQPDDSGQPSRPALPHRLIVVPDPPNANRPLPPTPRSNNSSSSQSQNSQQPQRNAPMVSKYESIENLVLSEGVMSVVKRLTFEILFIKNLFLFFHFHVVSSH